ncbi:MAG TPA: isochorismatase family cysteine hydrolase [Candidatus Binataceae bacterium]|nr:isochorismatase family cysteine hydrolase [Candidatus Binataceae bacterium]
MQPATTLFYDVDTQRDFIVPGGRLWIPGTERIIPALGALTQLAGRLGVKIVATTDRHFAGDPELERNGGAYPDHCMDGTEGQLKIEATLPRYPLFLENRDLSEVERATAIAWPGELVIEKQLFDAFAGNRNTAPILGAILKDYADVVVYGVYTEVCVADAVRGLQHFGKRLHLVIDATADIGDEGATFRQRWQAEGLALTTVSEITSGLEAA